MAETKKTFNQKLIAAMKEMDNPKKEKEGYNYKYETLEQVLGIVKPALEKQGMMLIQGVVWNESINGFVLETGVIDDSESRTLDMRPFHICDDAQSEGSWETYMRRYAIRTAFGLTGEDDDGAATLNTKSSTKGRPASDKQMGMMLSLIDELSMMRSQPIETVREALANVIGAQVPDMTSKQASEAIERLLAWKDKAKNEPKDEPQEMFEEDVAF